MLRHRMTAGETAIIFMSEKLLNGKQLATVMNRDPWYVCAMKAAGYAFPYPGRTTLSHALNWLSENPDFRTTGYANGQTPRANRQKKAAGKSGAPTQRNGSRNASPLPV